MSPVVSVMITMATMIIEMIAENWKSGMPNWNGCGMPTHAFSPTASQLGMPNGIEIRVPMIRPSSTDTRRIESGANRSMARMMTRVPKPNAMALGSPKSSPLAVPPPNQPAATRISDTPMITMMVPVTRGGKNLTSLPMTGAITIMKMPGRSPHRRWR